MVQLSFSPSRISSSFCLFRLICSLFCSDITTFTTGQEDAVSVSQVTSPWKQVDTLTEDAEGDDDGHQDDTNYSQTCCHQMR